MTLCYEVFLAGSFDDDERSSLEHMLHELYHTVQCVNRGGVGPFVDEYLLHGAVTIVQTGRLDIHDDIDHERDAQQRAVSLINRFGWPVVIENGCPTRLRVLVQILEASGDWVSHGWYEFDGGERSQLVSSSRYLHSRNGIWYLFAEEIDGDREWAGSASIAFEGETYRARMIDDTGESEALGTRLTCN